MNMNVHTISNTGSSPYVINIVSLSHYRKHKYKHSRLTMNIRHFRTRKNTLYPQQIMFAFFVNKWLYTI